MKLDKVKIQSNSDLLSYYYQALQRAKTKPIEHIKLAEIYCSMGKIYQQQMQLYHAFYCYELALQYEPSNQQAHHSSAMIAEQATNIIADEWFICNTLREPFPPITSEIKVEPFSLNLGLPELANSTEEVQLDFCKIFAQELNIALCRVDSMPELEAFLTVFSLKQLRPLLDKYPTHFSILGQGWQIAVANTLNNTPFKLTLKLFDIAKLLEKFSWKSSIKDQFFTQRKILETTFRNQNLMPVQRTNAAILLFAIDALQNKNSLALSNFIEKSTHLTDRLSVAMLAPLWNHLFSTGWFVDHSNLLDKLMNRYSCFFSQLNDCNNFFSYSIIDKLFNYSLKSSRDWNQSVFEKLILPCVQKLLSNNNHALALLLTNLTDFSYAQQPHTDEQHKLCWRAYLEDFLVAGHQIKQTHDLIGAKSPLNSDNVLRVGIVVSLVFNNCSPVNVLLQVANSLKNLPTRNIQIIIYAYEGVEKRDLFLIDEFASVGISIVDMFEHRGLSHRDNALDRIIALRNRMKDDNIDICVYTQSTLSFVAFSSAIGLAPAHILWSMGEAYSFRIPEVQGYMLFGLFEETKTIAGQLWDIFPLRNSESFRILTLPEIVQEAQRIRAKLLEHYTLILGCIARAQKIDNDEFMDMLASVLYRNPQAVFLWFGDQESPSVRQKMQVRNISEQCIFCGWADINVYTRVLDIHIECFPFPTGIAVLQCMSAGTACVHYFSQEAIEILTRYVFLALQDQAGGEKDRAELKRIFSSDAGQSLFLGTKDIETYTNFIQALIDSPELRYQVGQAGYQFIHSFLSDSEITAQGFCNTLQKIYQKAIRERSLC